MAVSRRNRHGVRSRPDQHGYLSWSRITCPVWTWDVLRMRSSHRGSIKTLVLCWHQGKSLAHRLVYYCYWSSLSLIVASTSFQSHITPSPPIDNIRVIVIVWRLRGNIIRTALCWIVWYNVHSQQHTYVSSSYRSNRLGLSHWDPYTVRRGGCLQLYYCNMVEWFWWDSSLIFDDQLVPFSALTLLVWSSGV